MENIRNVFNTKPKMLSLAVVLISLSVLTTATELRKCYWCGPLAEQVHKSTRAPACDDPAVHVTACDSGFTHCAVVATSPPYAESRLCVKLYQDECYSLYCNSTKIWRMTCPCLGDLCNGPNTQREKEAFLILTKLVDKSQNTRHKRTLISPTNSITNINNDIDNNINATRLNMTTNKDNVTADTNNAQSIEAKIENIETDLSTTEKNTNIIKIEITETMHQPEQTENDDEKNDNTVSTVLTTQAMLTAKHEETSTISLPYTNEQLPTAEALQDNASVNQRTPETTVTEAAVENAINTMHEIENPESTPSKTQTMDNIVSTEQVPTAVKQEESSSTSLPHPMKGIPTADALQQNASLNQNGIESTITEPLVKSTVQEIEISESTTYRTRSIANTVSTVSTEKVTEAMKHEGPSSVDLPHPSKENPTAEALQQNASLHENITESTVTEPSSKTTVHSMNEIKPSETSTHKNNTATQINNHILTLVSGILVHRYI